MNTQPGWISPFSVLRFSLALCFTVAILCCLEKLCPAATGAELLNTNSFQGHVDFAASGSQENSAAGDLDGDGRLDLVLPNTESQTVLIYRNVGASGGINSTSLQLTAELGCPGTPMSVAITDVDGDGKLDILVVSREGALSVFRNIGAIGNLGANAFATRSDFSIPSDDLRVLRVGDVDRDGKVDAAVCSGEGLIFILRNGGTIGNVQYDAAVSYPAEAGELVDLVLGDIDGDGKPDLLVANHSTADLSVLQNRSVPGPLTPASFGGYFVLAVGPNPYGVGLADLDGDGRPEVLALNSGSGTLSVFLNSSSPGTLVKTNFPLRAFNFLAAPGAMTLAVGDVNKDGKPDVAFANPGATAVSVFLNVSTGRGINASTLAEKVDFLTEGPSRSVLLADVDGDGNLDLVVSQAAPFFSLLRNSSPSASPPAIKTQPVSQSALPGTTIVLTVEATGDAPLTYQWRLNKQNLLGANESSLTLKDTLATQSGVYSVVVSNVAGAAESEEALVTINTPPTAQSQSISVRENETISIILGASDAENDPFTFSVTAPEHGQLTGVPPGLVYRPNPNYTGPDAFTFQANDGKSSSAVAIIAISVQAMNSAPVAASQNVVTEEDTAVALTLSASDVDGDVLTFSATVPAHGTLSGVAPNLVYTPAANYYGPDSFSFTARDATLVSAPATVSLTVRPMNHAPVARFTVAPLYPVPACTNCLAVLAVNNSNATIILDASLSTDPENDALQYFWLESSTTPFATGDRVSRPFSVGAHVITLIVSDGKASSMVSVQVQVITSSAVLEDMVSLIDAADLGKVPPSIYHDLESAQAALDSGDIKSALKRLESLQKKIEKQIAPGDPTSAALLDEAIQTLIDSVQRN